ncbi:MAG: agmatinase [Solirubrobacterales bacterium]|nr:agmatinase [Solirubrobacterales bacterium]MBV9425605.1 agmatinase [Solirubrobacterales bacterium]MBV9800171.1 agmatinase [Solirubrobacterales bacterium]
MAATDRDDSLDRTMWQTVLHAGLAGSFLRVPHVPPDAAGLREAHATAAIYGMPWDSTSISRTGANYGPRAIRDVSAQFLTYNATWDFDLLDALTLVDCGDCPVVLANAEKTFAVAEKAVGQIIEAGALPVVLGGDHSVTIPAVRAVSSRISDPGLVLIDTHLDTALDVGGETLNHCCPITRAVDAGFDPEKIALVAISGWMNPRTELRFCREHGIAVLWLEEIWEHGLRWAIDRAREIAGGDHSTGGIYLTVDVDSLDAAYAPGTCCPTPGGLTSRELLTLVRGIAAGGLIGLDVVETAPSLDATSATAAIAGRVVMDALAAHAGASVLEVS